MAVEFEKAAITEFADWYDDYRVDQRDGTLRNSTIGRGGGMVRRYEKYKREMDSRCGNYRKLEQMADGEVISPKPDLPNVSSGETAGLVRRIARNLVQHVPNVDITCTFPDTSEKGIVARYILNSKIIGADTYSNDMQQNLFASTKTALTIGFDCVVPILLQDAAGSWYVKYDTIHYRDVFPEPGAKDVRDATEVFVRRYLTKGEMLQLIRNQPDGWDVAALRTVLTAYPKPPNREPQSNSHQDSKRKVLAEGYEVITWYNSHGQPFLTFSGDSKHLLRIEKNVHPLKQHPVFFLVLEKDSQQPLGKSQVELLLGRQEFQDLMHNGAMKLWYRNINPSIIGYGAVGATPNLSPGKYTQFSNPNARIEAFEVNTQTLMQYSAISQGNLGAMVNLLGSADQQMAVQAGGGMSATPQGVEAQQAMVDITTNNYQKAIESFFSHYCSYALTIYFQELKGVKGLQPSSDARQKLLGAGLDESLIDGNGHIDLDFKDMAEVYYVRCVPGSLVELEEEKQLRILNQLFVPLSQAMPAMAATQNGELLSNMALAMQFIVQREIELSGSNRAKELKNLLVTGDVSDPLEQEELDAVEDEISSFGSAVEASVSSAAAIASLQQQVSLLAQTQTEILRALGAANAPSAPQEQNPAAAQEPAVARP